MEQRNTDTGKHFDVIPAALTIAGSDSGGGAGIQADLRTFTAHGVFGCSVITAVTAQNPLAVTDVEPVSPEVVCAQLRAVFAALDIRAVKTGMLFSAEIIDAVADELEKRDSAVPLVVDPVMISTSGSKLLKDDALALLQTRILPIADWITPNMPEAEMLSGRKITDRTSAVAAAELIAARWNVGVILKGGHAEGEQESADIICVGEKRFKLSSPRLALPPLTSHGTGCTFSAALAANLAKGMAFSDALCRAKAFVFGSLAEAKCIGRGNLCGMFPPQDAASYLKMISIGTV